MAQCFFVIGVSKPNPVSWRVPITSDRQFTHEKGTNPITRRSRYKQLPILGTILQVLMKRYLKRLPKVDVPSVFRFQRGFLHIWRPRDPLFLMPTCFIESSGCPAKSNAKVRLDIRTGWWFGTFFIFHNI